jgi:hypothetical protein
MRRDGLMTRHRVFQTGLKTLLSLAVVGSISVSAQASPIRASSRVVTDIDSLGPVWAQFLSFGPTFWAHHHAPPIPSGLILPTQNGLLVETPFVEYLSWRRSLAPARFDYYHPIIGPELGLLKPPTPTSTSTSTSTPTPSGTTRGGGGKPVNPVLQSTVPEPGSILIAVVMVGSAFGWGLRKRWLG